MGDTAGGDVIEGLVLDWLFDAAKWVLPISIIVVLAAGVVTAVLGLEQYRDKTRPVLLVALAVTIAR